MNFKGTKTEKNLWEAFAGESQARNKYTYFASVAKKEGYQQIAAITRKSMQSFGSRLSVNWGIQRKTCSVPQRAKIMNGPICMSVLQKMRRKKVLLILPNSSGWSQPSRRLTRKGTASFSAM
jgi:hypothetical protein